MAKKILKLNVNGDQYELLVKPKKTLLEVLRDDIGLTGTKYACGTGECGACTVLVNGKATLSCLTLAAAVEEKQITTIEGLAVGGKLHPIQEAFVKHGALQCGYCTPGFIMSVKSLLDENPNPTEKDVREYLVGNLCRCTGYSKIIDAVLAASKATS